MLGYQLTFFTQQDRNRQGRPLGQWLIEEARTMGIGGATLTTAAEGFGHDRKLRSVHFVELTDQPVQVTMAVSEADAKRLLARIKEAGVNVFYVKAPIEFGMTGEL
jgi:uncharacterized protein